MHDLSGTPHQSQSTTIVSRWKCFKVRLAAFFDKPWKFPLVVFLAVLTVGIPRLVGPMAKAHVQFGIDLQEFKCLPYTFYWFTSGRVHPRSDEVKSIALQYNQFVSFVPSNNMMGLPQLDGKRVVKMVAGLPGDVFEVKDDVAYINGERWGDLTLLQTLGKTPGSYDRRVVIPEGQVLLLGNTEFSYDGRYYGLIDQREINAQAHPVF